MNLSDSKISVALLTCDRPDYTKRTIESFFKLNQHQLDRFNFYYADDASTTDENVRIADGYSFTQLIKNKKREGCSQTTAKLMSSVANEDFAPLILYLQNDMESVRPVPITALLMLLHDYPELGGVRLYGDFKTTSPYNATPIGTRHIGVAGKPTIYWQDITPCPMTEQFQYAYAHLALQPFVIKRELVPQVFKIPKKSKDINQAYAETGKMTGRTLSNVFSHFGHTKTPEGVWGRPRYDKSKN